MNRIIKITLRYLFFGVLTFVYFWIMYFVSYGISNSKSNDVDEKKETRYALKGKWKIVKSTSGNVSDSSDYKGIEISRPDSLPEWYRGELIWLVYNSVDADTVLFHRPLYITLRQIGASEIFIDGKSILKVGNPSNNIEEEKCINESQPMLLFLNKPFTISIKHSELNPMKWKNKINYEYTSGLKFSISDTLQGEHNEIILPFIIGFLITLFFIHLLMFLFYRDIKDNLYFALFLLSYTLVWVSMLFSNSGAFYLDLISRMLFDIIISATFISLILFVQYLFQEYLNKIVWLIISASFLVSVLNIFIDNEALYIIKIVSTIWLIIFSIIYVFVAVWKTSRKKTPGIKIVSLGISVFGFLVFTIISIFFYALINKIISPNLDISISFSGNTIISLILVIIFLLALFSIPISMSIYLAYKFAYTNVNLKNKLIEVEGLNRTIIEKEREKQMILQKQNEFLEQQVKERTQEIIYQKNLIEQKNKDITDSINYASRIQNALITSNDYIQKHFINEHIFSDYFVLYLPKDIVSGDFYWANVNLLHPNYPHYLVIGDCTGHGVPGAFMSLLNINYLNEAVQEKQLYYPNEIFDYVRNKLIQNLSYDEQQKDGMDASMLMFDKDFMNNKKIYYTLANHQLLYIKNNHAPQILTGDKMPVGKGHFESKFNLCSLQLEKNDLIYLYTDGYKDQFGGEKGKRIMHKKFIEIISEIKTKNMAEQKSALLDFFNAWKKDNEQTDDVCIIGIKI